MVIPEISSPTPPLSVWSAVNDHLAAGPPDWFPYSTPAVSEWQILKLRAPTVNDLPTEAVAFDRLGQAKEPAHTMVHFYVQDAKLRGQATKPRRYAAKFETFWGITSPDFSIGADMPTQRRIDAVWWNRAVGAFYQSRGIRVIPHIRWCDRRDYEYCFLGVEKNSVVAVSNYGCWRDRALRQGFLHGLSVMIEQLQPSIVFVYGTISHPLFRQLRSKTEFVHLETERTRARKKAA